ncbi:MAG: hypothetical protein ACMXYL_00275 [Candidatus Woesearchaeota archaeon]
MVANKTTKAKKTTKKKVVHPKPYSDLTFYQKKMREEIRKLHDATETFVRIAVNKTAKENKIHEIEEHILEIGRNIDELEDLLHDISKGKV